MTLIDPKTLRVHALLKGSPEWAEDDPRFLALVDDIKANGIIEPVRVTPDLEIVDGRHRWRACKRLRLEVPVVTLDGENLAEFALRTLLMRRHYNPSQRALIAAPLLEPAFQEARRRMKSGVKTDIAQRSEGYEIGSGTLQTLEMWAETLTLSVRLLRMAREVVVLFQDDTKRSITDRDDLTEDEVTFEEFFAKRILREDHPYGLGDALKAMKQIIDQENKTKDGRPPTGGRPNAVAKQLELFNEVFDTATKRFAYWAQFDAQTRKQHLATVTEHAAKLAPDELKVQADYYAQLAKTLRKAAKRAKWKMSANS